jgi:nucleotide sugar dehydrogenase
MSGEDCVVIGGMGFVGRATRMSLNITHYFDLKESNITLEQASKKLFIFLCLPTPTDEKGGQESGVNLARDYIRQIKEYGGRNIFVVRSTVIPGTCRALAKEFDVMVCSNPELMSEDTWERDATNPRLTILGADDIPSRNALVDLWKPVKSKKTIVVDTVTSEMMKYAFNTFFISKIVYANQIYDACEKAGANYKEIREALMYHPWGSKHHFKVFHKGGRGGGGHCFPKDIKAFAKWSNLPFFQKVEELNNKYLLESRKE